MAVVTTEISKMRLEVAVQKTEATWFHGLPRTKRPPTSWIAVAGDRVPVGRSIKYLGLVLDDRLSFEPHFAQLTPRVEKVALSLSRILPNIGGLKAKIRRLYAAVTGSMVLYGAPIWAKEDPLSRQNVKALRSAQRQMAIRAIRSYRTVSSEAAIILVGMVPFDHLAKAHAKVYWRTRRKGGQDQQPATRADPSTASETTGLPLRMA